MLMRFHPLVQYAHDLNEVGCDHAVVEDMRGPLHLGLRIVAADMADVKASDSGKKVRAIPRHRRQGIGCDFAHRGCKDYRVAASSLNAPSLSTCGQDMRKIGFGGS
jgi:hypothetical protein